MFIFRCSLSLFPPCYYKCCKPYLFVIKKIKNQINAKMSFEKVRMFDF